jgi:hypothetical protein
MVQNGPPNKPFLWIQHPNVVHRPGRASFTLMERSLTTTSLHFSYFIRIACLLLIGLLRLPSSWADEGPWSLSYTSQLGATTQFCHREKCKKDQDAYAAQLLKVCLHRDPATLGIFTRGDWRAQVAPVDRNLCKEVLYADAQQKKLFVAAAA